MLNKIIGTIFIIATVILSIDFFGLMVWVLSGQTPVDSFYIGAITKNILMFLFF